MANLLVSVLGPLEVISGKEPVTAFESDKVRALLAFLVVEADRPHPREKLAEFLWPDRRSGAALGNLRHALTILRRAIDNDKADLPYLLITRKSIQFNLSADVWVDIADFTQYVAHSGDGQDSLHVLEKAAALIRGSFLDGLSSGDSDALEEWLLFQREQIKSEHLQILNKLSTHAELDSDYHRAIRYTRQRIGLAPWDEQGYQELMRLLALSDRGGEALAQFEICRQRLAEELNVSPSPETVALYNRIKSGAFKPPLSELHRQHVRGYRLGACIGVGHAGAVYRAYQPVVGRDVAIKIILPQFTGRPSFIRRFEAEARTVAHLEHPHIVPLYDFWRDPEGAYLVMRWLRRGSLQDSLTEGPWPAELGARLVDQISGALAAAHQQGVIHQDVKPANILLDEAGNGYLSDFGIAITDEGPEAGKPRSYETATGSLGYLSPEAVQGGVVSAATDIYSLGVVIYELFTGQHPFPNLPSKALIEKHLSEPLPKVRDLQPELPAAVDDVIQLATAKDPGERFASAPALATALRRALRLSALPATTLADSSVILSNPYRGLQPFQEADAPFFFGRGTTIQQLVARMQETGTGDHFLAVVGPSGCGKSSLIKAGLLPAIRAGTVEGSENWFVIELAPSINLQEGLALSLLSIAADSPPEFQRILSSDELGLMRAAELVLPDEESELLLIIDQFEAIFDSSVSQTERELLLNQICTAVNSAGSRVHVVIGLRADFYDRPLANPGFSQLLGRRTATVGPLTNEELIQAIEGPAKISGVELESGLMAKIVVDVSEQSGALPMLQYALTELFDRRQGRWLRAETYQSIGGLSGALVQRAESLYAELDEGEQRTARQLFLRLVSLSGDTRDSVPAPTARWRVLRSELESLHDAEGLTAPRSADAPDGVVSLPSSIGTVIESFGAARLLTFDREPSTREPTVEVAHEALIWEWPRLRGWLDESREHLLKQRLLSQAAGEWMAADQDPSFLLRGTRLDQFEQWAESTDLALNDMERFFLDNALQQRAARQAEEAARVQREKQLERRSRTFLGTLAGVLALATVIALLLMLYAFGQQREALEAYSLSLIANAKQAMDDGDTATALVLTLAANELTDPPLEARRTLLGTAYAPGARQRYEVSALFPDLTGPITALAMSPDGQQVGIGFAGGTIVLWDWEAEREIGRLTGHNGQVNDVAFSSDGRSAISGGDDGRVIIWDLDNGSPIRELVGHTGPVQAVDISADGQRALSGGYGSASFRDPGQLVLWELPSGKELLRFEDGKTGLVEAQFALDGTAVLASFGDAELLTDLGSDREGQELLVETLLWDTVSGEVMIPITSFAHDAFSMAIAPDQQHALIGSYYDNIASVVDLRSGETLQVLEGHHDGVSVVQYSTDGNRVLTGSHDGSLILWDLASAEALFHFMVHQGEVSDLVMTPDGRTALSASRSGELIRWDLNDAADLAHYYGHGDMVYDTAFLADGSQFLSVSGGSNPARPTQDTSVRLWDVASGQQLRAKDLALEVLFQIDVTPNGKQALVAGMAPMVIVLDAATLEQIGQLEGHQGWVTGVEISPDGRHAVTVAVDGSIILWDLSDQRLVRRIETGAAGGLWAVAMSPDGRTALAETDEGAVGLWDLASGERLNKFVIDGFSGAGSTGIAFLPDGQSAIAQGANGFIYHWDLQSGELIHVLGQHNDIRTRIELTPDGRKALSSGMDGVLMLWDLENGELIRRFGTPGQMIFDVAISPDGLTALSGSSDKSIIRWQLDSQDSLELKDWIAANRFVRELSCDEHDLYQIEPYCSGG